MTKIIPTEEEVRLLRCFEDSYWVPRADRARMRGTFIESASVTKSGVVADVRLDGSTDIEELKRLIPKIRIILDAKDADIVDVATGGSGSRVQIAVRTRRATDDMDMTWHPGITSLGVDTVTGEEVDVPWNERILVSGSSGSGKSWSTRPLIARAVVDPMHEIAGLVDAKGDEANKWRGVIPVSVHPDEIVGMVEDIYEESCSRGRIMEREALDVWDLRLGPRKYLFIDEGQKAYSTILAEDRRRKKVKGGEDGEDGEGIGVLDVELDQKLLELTSIGRSREIVVIWATQNPLLSGKAPGIPSLIRTNFDYSFCLRVNTEKNTETALGQGAGVAPHKLARGDRYRGHGYLNEHNENLIRTWKVTNEAIRSLAHYR